MEKRVGELMAKLREIEAAEQHELIDDLVTWMEALEAADQRKRRRAHLKVIDGGLARPKRRPDPGSLEDLDAIFARAHNALVEKGRAAKGSA